MRRRYPPFHVTVSMTEPTNNDAAREILALADQCVKCGMCQTVCPTYRLRRHEAESPRGRIALVQGLLEGRLQATPGLIGHLDNCLQCRACELICPSRVSYQRIIEHAVQSLSALRKPPRAARNLLHLLTALRRGPWLATLALTLLRLARVSALGRLAARRAGLPRVDAVTPTTLAIPVAKTAASLPPPATLTLFAGCLSDLLQAPTVNAATAVLASLGYQVRLPDDRLCCGGLHRRQGDLTQAQALHRQTTQTHTAGTPLVSLVSACTLTLREGGLGDAVDFASFVASHWPTQIKPRDFPRTLLVHESCSLRNGLREQASLYGVLKRIPGARVIALQDNAVCCGAGATHRLTDPPAARAMLADKLRQIRAVDDPIVVSSNLGCALHLRAELENAGIQASVLHPAQVLALVLPDDGGNLPV